MLGNTKSNLRYFATIVTTWKRHFLPIKGMNIKKCMHSGIDAKKYIRLPDLPLSLKLYEFISGRIHRHDKEAEQDQAE